MDWGAEYVGTILLFVGVFFVLWKRKRKFDRTNNFGVEQFSSFWGKLGAKTKDGLIGVTALMLLSSGLLILAFRFQDSWGWIVLLPLYAFMLFMLVGT